MSKIIETEVYESASVCNINVDIADRAVGGVVVECACTGSMKPLEVYTAANYDEFLICSDFGSRTSCNTAIKSAVLDEVSDMEPVSRARYERLESQTP